MKLTVAGESLELNFQDFVIDSGRISGKKQLESMLDLFKTMKVVHVVMVEDKPITHWWIFRNLVAFVGDEPAFKEMEAAWEKKCQEGDIPDLG